MAQGEAQRMRQMVQTETEQMLDLSARTISTIQARTAGRCARRSRCRPLPPRSKRRKAKASRAWRAS